MIASGMVARAAAGQHEVDEGVPGGVGPADEEPVEDEEARRVLGEEPGVLPPGRREPREPDGEGVLEDVAEHEDRDGHAEQRGQHGRGVHPGLVAAGGHVAERDAEPDGDEQGEHRQLDGRREQAEQLLGHRRPGGGRDAEVALHHASHVRQVLLEDRAVEAVQPVELPDGVGGRPLAEQRLRGPPGQRPDPGEQQHAEADEDRHEQQQPPDDESEHRGPSAEGVRRAGAGGGRTATRAAVRVTRTRRPSPG